MNPIPDPTAEQVYDQLRRETDDGKPTWEELAQADKLKWDYRVAQAATAAAEQEAFKADPVKGDALATMTVIEAGDVRNHDSAYLQAATAEEKAWDAQRDAAERLTEHAGRAMGADRGHVDNFAHAYWPKELEGDIRDAAWDDTGGGWPDGTDWFGNNRPTTLMEREYEWDLEPTSARSSTDRGVERGD